MNASTLIVALLLGVALVSIAVVTVRNRRKGKCSCGGSCGGCGMQGLCHQKASDAQSPQAHS